MKRTTLLLTFLWVSSGFATECYMYQVAKKKDRPDWLKPYSATKVVENYFRNGGDEFEKKQIDGLLKDGLQATDIDFVPGVKFKGCETMVATLSRSGSSGMTLNLYSFEKSNTGSVCTYVMPSNSLRFVTCKK